MKKTVAFCGLGAVLLVLAVLARREPALLPVGLRAGDPVVAPLEQIIRVPRDSTTRVIDVVMVSRDCGACRTLVDQLAKRSGEPQPEHHAVFVTDRPWERLLALRRDRVGVVVDDTLLARAIGLRATPTLIAWDTRTSRVRTVAVGVNEVLDQFAMGDR